jgi:hypothetical protein
VSTDVEMVRGYGCVRCQEFHHEGDAEYDAHMGFQCRHGTYLIALKDLPRERAYRAATGGCHG